MKLTDIIERYRLRYEDRYASTITFAQRHAMDAILQCRSGRFGQMELDCSKCDYHCVQNHSCGHRFCHRCQHHDTSQWLERQSAKLLPVNYFLITFTLPAQLRSLTALDGWVRRRLRMCYWKQWRKPRTRIRELIKLGVSKREAISLGLSRKSYWRLSKTLATNAGLSNAHFESIGLISMRTLWCKIHHPATAR